MKKIWFVLVFSLIPIFTLEAAIEVTLEKVLAMTKQNSHEIKEVRWGEDFRQGQWNEAKSAYFPKVELLGAIAPMYEIKGNINGSESSWGSWKPYYLLDAQLLFPLHTFGKASNLKNAGKNAFEAAKAETEIKLNQVILSTKEYYYLYQLSKTMFGTAISAKKTLQDAIKQADKLVKKNKLKKQSLLKLKVFYAQGMEKYELVKKGLIVAKGALLLQMGLPQTEQLKVIDHKLLPVGFELKPLDHYVELAKDIRPEYKMAKHGVEAYKSLAEAEKANHFPNLFVGGQVKYRQTDNVTDQKGAFVRDDYNSLEPGVAVGLQWKWDYGTIKAKSKQKNAEYMKIVEKARYGMLAIPMDIKRCYYDVKEALNNMKNHEPGMKAAEEWKVIEVANYFIGIGEAQDLLEGLGAHVLSKFNYYNAVLKYNMAVAKLSVAVGKELGNLKY